MYTQDVRTRFRLSLRAANILAVVQTELEAWQAIAQHRSVAIETVLSSSKYLPLVQTARRRGFETVLIYTGLPSVRFSVARVAARVQAGGHNVPRRKLLERWGRSLDNFVTFMAHCDEVVLFSNAGSEPVLVGNRTAGGPFNLYEPNELPEITARLRSAGLVP